MEEARKLAEAEGVALNQLINVAVAEKLSALRTADYFTARAARADVRDQATTDCVTPTDASAGSP